MQMEHLFFYIALGFIFTHEMDAVRCKEWQIFPGLSLLKNEMGYRVFTLLHVPLYFFLLWELFNPPINESLIWWLDLFFIIHIGLHLLLLRHPKNLFTSLTSWTIITGAGLFGLLDLIFGF